MDRFTSEQIMKFPVFLTEVKTDIDSSTRSALDEESGTAGAGFEW